MDAVKFLGEVKRMCSKHRSCVGCLLENYSCNFRKIENPEELITIVEKWSKEHPLKTRQSEFLKMFPNADIADGHLLICPKDIDSTLKGRISCNESCNDCKKVYWNAEAE